MVKRLFYLELVGISATHDKEIWLEEFDTDRTYWMQA